MYVWVLRHKEIIMATVNKDFKVKNGLIVEGANATVNGSDIITEDIITGGTQTNITVSYDAQLKVLSFEAENGVADSTTADLAEDPAATTSSGTMYFTNQRALDATSAAYDVAGAAAAAQTAAESYADGLAVNYDVAGAAAAAQSAAESFATTAISDLVGGAPELLDTLNELAAALGDDENFATSVSTAIGLKQDALTAGSNIDISGATISVTGLTTDDVSEEVSATNLYFTDARAVDALEAVVPNFTAVEVNSLAKQVAATSSSLGSVVVTAYSFPKATYKTAKFIVKVDNGTHNEVSEVLLTLDSSDNIAITEYAIVATNGSRGTITADISGTDVRLRVDPVNDSTINVVGTLLA